MGFENAEASHLFISTAEVIENLASKYPTATRMMETTIVARKKGVDWKSQKVKIAKM